jgi:transposase
MVKPLSMDLRERELACIGSGVSGRQAAERFGVSAASVSRWRVREREQGDAEPRAQGGDRKSHRIDSHRATIMALLKVLAETRSDIWCLVERSGFGVGCDQAAIIFSFA